MTTVSYPAVGNGGMSASQWPTVLGVGDGIINDYVGTACALQRLDASDICRVQPGKIRVGGYILDITAAEDLYCPPVATGNPAVNYHIAAMYDPALNVADGSGNAAAAGPCRLIINAGPPSTAGGKKYVLLYTLFRSPSQTLSATAKDDFRWWVGPQIEVNMESGLPTPGDTPTGFGPFPRGTTAWNASSRTLAHYTLNAAGTALDWSAGSAELPLSLTAGFTNVTGEGDARYSVDASRRVILRGTVRRSSGANIVSSASNTDVLIGSVPYRPTSVRRLPVYTDGQQLGWVKVTAEGSLYVYASGVNIAWVDLSGVQFQAM